MTDEQRLADPSPILPYLPPHSAVIIRRREIGDSEDMARQIMARAHLHGVNVLISASRPPDRLEADGVHIPEQAMRHWSASDFRRLRPALVTASAHSERAVTCARKLGVDAVLLSPVFPTQSHDGTYALGIMRFAGICRRAGLPVIALGGVSGHRLRRVFRAGAAGVAGIGLFLPS
ncbi:MAG: thiamine phosphate synthase [Rhodospirillales bacterium]|nr:thiamine phosphate synthase [Rhodospirillales bacterium]MBO6787645.1 thiamine phosphate synthase [Rhodospirillales bacterium]